MMHGIPFKIQNSGDQLHRSGNMRRDFAGFRLDHHRPLHPSAIVSQMPTISDAEYE
jgi:hypothetical protein